jgi:coproporphyrinogen III oxidase-like Fe-S oxidoreductase
MPDPSPYQGYLYAYPHKSAYRPLEPRPPLREVWAGEPRDSLFLYVHVPFCEMRCGFCNLFTRSNPPPEQAGAYLRQLRVQAEVVHAAIGPLRYSRAAVGGGTPTYLTAAQLEELFRILPQLDRVPLSVETSPATATEDRLQVLAAHGTWRVSMGVQSFLDSEAHAAGRPQRRADVEGALQALHVAAFPVLNLDLIYGIPGQTSATWEQSLRETLRHRPEEVYLYPLYVRPLTGLGRRGETPGERAGRTDSADPAWDAQRLALYRQGRDRLRENGYVQLSMRQFRRCDAPVADGDDYCCQDDGMIGLGCGARSYTRALHYSFDYAVGIREVRGIIDDYLARPRADFTYAEHGIRLDGAEQRLEQPADPLLRAEGVDLTAYQARFGEPLTHDLAPLYDRGWAVDEGDRVVLTDEGLAHSDAIGPWLISGAVRDLMARAVLR